MNKEQKIIRIFYIFISIFISLFLILTGFLAGYLIKQNKPKKIEKIQSVEDQQEIPECLFGRCPQYLDSSWYAYGEDPAGSVIIVPTTMTKGGGQVWIIHAGKVVYKTPTFAEVNAWIDRTNDKSDLYISYVSEWKDGIWPMAYETDKLIYKDGNYQLVKVSTKNVE